jgi:hypothetical protein
MTGDELRAARRTLGEMWGLGRPLHAAELGRLLNLRGPDPGQSVLDWERTGPTGPAAIAIELMIATGEKPSTYDAAIRR